MFFIRRWRRFYHCKNRLQADRVCELFDKENIRYKLKSKEINSNQTANPHAGSFTFKVYWRDYNRAKEHEVFRDLPSRTLK